MSVKDRVINSELAKYEAVIERGMRTIIEVGMAMKAIRDNKLYKGQHETFELYVKNRWECSKTRAYQLIEAAEVDANLSTIVDKSDLPQMESQLREVGKAPPEMQAEVVKKAVEKAAEENRKPTAKDYKEAVKQVTGELLDEGEEEEIEEDEEEIEEEPTIQEICDQDNKAIESFCRAAVKQFEKDVPKLPWTQDSGRIESALASLKAGLTTLRGAKAVICSACVDGRTDKGQCRYCKGHGYLPVYQADAIPEDARL